MKPTPNSDSFDQSALPSRARSRSPPSPPPNNESPTTHPWTHQLLKGGARPTRCRPKPRSRKGRGTPCHVQPPEGAAGNRPSKRRRRRRRRWCACGGGERRRRRRAYKRRGRQRPAVRRRAPERDGARGGGAGLARPRRGREVPPLPSVHCTWAAQARPAGREGGGRNGITGLQAHEQPHLQACSSSSSSSSSSSMRGLQRRGSRDTI